MTKFWGTRKKSSMKCRGAGTSRKRGREGEGRRSLVVRGKEKEATQSLFSIWRKGLFRDHAWRKSSGPRNGIRTWKQGDDKTVASAL